MFLSLPAALQFLITAFLGQQQRPPQNPSLTFHLRHAHGVAADQPRIVFSDLPASSSLTSEPWTISTTAVRTFKPPSFDSFTRARHRSMRFAESAMLEWRDEDVDGPDVTKRENLLLMAKMTYNSYYDHGSKEWYGLGKEWNTSYPFGWEPDMDGFRGHVFVSEDESTVIVTVKGTSAPWLVGGGGPTVKKDKLNDNLLFSCCCAKVGPTWWAVCDCATGGRKCDQTCVEQALVEDSLFYPVGTNLYNNVSYMYPEANIWLVGHSLGGSLASLLGATFGVPVVAFEAPGERMAAQRLHLPSAPSLQHITHVYHTADPIPMGACTGVSSVCAIGGYALESRCHLGKTILFDTVTNKGWGVSAQLHPIQSIIEKVLNEDWDPVNGISIPPAVPELDCVDCFEWEYGAFKNVSKKDY